MCLQWHALTREEQAKYYELARKERQLHMQLYPTWSARDNYVRTLSSSSPPPPPSVFSVSWRRDLRPSETLCQFVKPEKNKNIKPGAEWRSELWLTQQNQEIRGHWVKVKVLLKCCAI